MNARGLIAYIRSELDNFTPREKIVERLITSGWTKEEVDRAFAEIDLAPKRALPVNFPLLAPKKSKSRAKKVLLWMTITPATLFVIFSISFNLGLFGDPDALIFGGHEPVAVDMEEDQFVNPASAVASTEPATSSLPAKLILPVQKKTVVKQSPEPLVPKTINTISSYDKEQMIIAIMTQNMVLGSGDAARIRAYLKAIADSATASSYDTMTDAQINDLAIKLSSGSEYVTAESLSSSLAVWTMQDSVTAVVSIQGGGQTIVRTVKKVGGVWY